MSGADGKRTWACAHQRVFTPADHTKLRAHTQAYVVPEPRKSSIFLSFETRERSCMTRSGYPWAATAMARVSGRGPVTRLKHTLDVSFRKQENSNNKMETLALRLLSSLQKEIDEKSFASAEGRPLVLDVTTIMLTQYARAAAPICSPAGKFRHHREALLISPPPTSPYTLRTTVRFSSVPLSVRLSCPLLHTEFKQKRCGITEAEEL